MIKEWLRAQNERIKRVMGERVADGCPPVVATQYANPQSLARARFLGDGLSDGSSVLIVGDAFGREYYYLRARGCNVTVLDLGPSALIPNVVVGDVSSTLPFADHSFDAVIAAEVIEHLIEDVHGLREVRRVLKPTGTLRLTVPFFHDIPEYHVRIHSPKSIRRVLQAAGFAVVEQRFCGAMAAAETSERVAVRLFGVLASSLLAQNRADELTFKLIDRAAQLHLDLGRLPSDVHELGGRWLHRYGVLLRANKIDPVDFVQVNRDEFARAK